MNYNNRKRTPEERAAKVQSRYNAAHEFRELIWRHIGDRSAAQMGRDLGIAESVMTAWLSGVRCPTLESVIDVCRKLGVSPREAMPES